jgi:predicted HicB family RNase H-like nuclease
MITTEEIQKFLLKATPLVKKAIESKAKEAKVSVEEYLSTADTRFCLVFVDNDCLVGISDMDSDYHRYLVTSKRDTLEEDTHEFIRNEFTALSHLCKFEKNDREMFYKWGYCFSIDENGSLSIRGVDKGFINIEPQAGNAIKINQCKRL